MVQEDTSDLEQAVKDALRAPYQRMARHQTRNGSAFWLKRVERSSPFLWLVKGLPQKAFDRDRRSHRLLWSWGAPVPAILMEGDGFLAIEDAGTSLTKLCQVISVAEKEKACSAAGQALARLHAADLAHGRPAFRDMCWDGHRIRFIDFEYFTPAKAGRIRKARDIGIALLSAMSQGLKGPRYAYRLASAYYRAAWSQKAARIRSPISDPGFR